MSLRARIFQGDALEVLPRLPDGCFDSVVTDPPYGLEFMGKEWDSFRTGDGFRRSRNQADAGRGSVFGRMSRTSPEYVAGLNFQGWCEQWDAECFRLLKPGGYLVAFGGTRTYHRLVCAIEDAGFEIRDSLHWIYGSGFPKSLNIGKAIDKAAGAERKVLGASKYANKGRTLTNQVYAQATPSDREVITAPATADAARWDGWGTALKPAHEPIVLARKPLEGTVASNVLAYGTGAINIGGCRVAHVSSADLAESQGKNPGRGDTVTSEVYGAGRPQQSVNGDGRWPPNLLLTHSADCRPVGTRRTKSKNAVMTRSGSGETNEVFGAHVGRARGLGEFGYAGADGMETVQAWECAEGCPVAGLDAQSGIVKGQRGMTQHSSANQIYGEFVPSEKSTGGEGTKDTGGASRFFPQFAWDPDYDLPFLYCPKAPKKERPQVEGLPGHPTVKPLALMRWLARLVTPPGGTVLEPFAGTGTTVQACLDEGFRCVAVERDPDSIRRIEVRLSDYAGVGYKVMEPVTEEAAV